MKTSIEIANLTKKKIDPDLVKKVVRKTVKVGRSGFGVVLICRLFLSVKRKAGK